MTSKNYFRIIALILVLFSGFFYWRAFSPTQPANTFSGGNPDPADCAEFLGKAAELYHSDMDQDKKSQWLDEHVWNRKFTWKMLVSGILESKVGGHVLEVECGDQKKFTIQLALTGEDRTKPLPFILGSTYTFTSRVVMIHNLVHGANGMDLTDIPRVSFDLEYLGNLSQM